ncbi:MAG TPA: response regulator transcription factor [Anaerolineae bacterium]|nr:response regulator transcription factor [Anaerolineae bacterium]HMR65859.1 response regulator transcription factor [Anaerolineae bacterium]
MNDQPSILLVDDHLDLLLMIATALESQGYRVLTAQDGQEGLEILQMCPVDVIIADIAMPRLNGYQLYEEIRHNPAWTAIPFIFLTARAMDSDIRYGKALGADDYLVKPINMKDLLAVVKGKVLRVKQLRQLQQVPANRGDFPLEFQPEIVQAGALKLDTGRRLVWFHNHEIRLSVREFCFLEMLTRHANQAVPTRTLIEAAYELDNDAVEAGVLARSLIRSIRRKLGYGAGEKGCIENVRGAGYKLIPPL